MRALSAALFVAGCVGTTAPEPTGGPIAPIVLDERGIDVVGTGRRIDFGRDRLGVDQTMTRLRGEAPISVNCVDPSRTALLWGSDVTLVFQNNAFVGWAAIDDTLSFDGRFTFGQVCIGRA